MIFLYEGFVWTWCKFRGEKQCRSCGEKIVAGYRPITNTRRRGDRLCARCAKIIAGGEEKT